jgi:hypothetical protein
MLDHRRGVTDLAPAVTQMDATSLYRQAAEQGVDICQFNLGAHLANGDTMPKDESEAVRWYRKAADQGYALAQLNLGAMYMDGRGVAKDQVEGVAWYSKAADQGNALAQVNLGRAYLYGVGVRKDEAKARKLLASATAQGDQDAKTILADLTATQKASAAAKEHLRQQYAGVVKLSKKGFERWVESASSVIGARIFDRVEVSDQALYLWLRDAEFLQPNLRSFADYCNAFSAWCKCDGTAFVGVDNSYLGAGKSVVLRFKFNASQGQCVMG